MSWMRWWAGRRAMASLVVPESSARWYTVDGKPAPKVTMENGRERTPTIREAREYGYLPSVTSILNVINKPGLTAWRINQYLMAARTLPQYPDETEDDFLQRVIQDAQEKTRKS